MVKAGPMLPAMAMSERKLHMLQDSLLVRVVPVSHSLD